MNSDLETSAFEQLALANKNPSKESYEKVANDFKLIKRWNEAGDCFQYCARIAEENNEDPSKYYEEAAMCWKELNQIRSKLQFIIKQYNLGMNITLSKCIPFYESKGNFSAAGNIQKLLAEEKLGSFNTDATIQELQKAIDYYEKIKENLDSTTETNKDFCLLKIADIHFQTKNEKEYEKCKQVRI